MCPEAESKVWLKYWLIGVLQPAVEYVPKYIEENLK